MYNGIGLFELYTHNLSATIIYLVLFSIYMSQRTEGGHNHVLDKIQTDKKFRTERKHFN